MMLGMSALLRTTTITTIILVYPETNYISPTTSGLHSDNQSSRR